LAVGSGVYSKVGFGEGADDAEEHGH
jgi:hypothetical protein